MDIFARMLVALLDALPDPPAEIKLRRQLVSEAYLDGRRRGWREGREALLREQALAARVADGTISAIAAGLTYAELETRRYGPGGREHFGDPRPGDRFPRIRLEAAS